jgi:hypothetical protein
MFDASHNDEQGNPCHSNTPFVSSVSTLLLSTMDLGFGKSNQVVGSVAANAILQSTKAQEAALEQEISRYDALLLQNDDGLEELRARRIEQMKREQQKRQQYTALGHGTYSELGGGGGGNNSSDIAKEFFEASKQSERLVVHFYRPTTRLCDVFHRHLAILAERHLETRFVKINVENCDNASGSGASFLVERLGIVIMPTVVIVKNRQAVHHVRGFDEVGGTQDFSTEAFGYVLSVHGAVHAKDDEVPEAIVNPNNDGTRSTAPKGVNSIRINNGHIRRSRYETEEDF